MGWAETGRGDCGSGDLLRAWPDREPEAQLEGPATRVVAMGASAYVSSDRSHARATRANAPHGRRARTSDHTSCSVGATQTPAAHARVPTPRPRRMGESRAVDCRPCSG